MASRPVRVVERFWCSFRQKGSSDVFLFLRRPREFAKPQREPVKSDRWLKFLSQTTCEQTGPGNPVCLVNYLCRRHWISSGIKYKAQLVVIMVIISHLAASSESRLIKRVFSSRQKLTFSSKTFVQICANLSSYPKSAITSSPEVNAAEARNLPLIRVLCHSWNVWINTPNCLYQCIDVAYKEQRKTIQINQTTRSNSFTSLLLDVYMWLNMFRASLRPS
jgi:hypothetical protein